MEAEKTIFAETFGDCPQVRVLDFFLTFDRFDYSKSQVAKETGVSRVTLDDVWSELARERIIVKTRRIGRAELYQLNNKEPVVEVLKEMQLKLATAYAEKEAAGKHAITTKIKAR